MYLLEYTQTISGRINGAAITWLLQIKKEPSGMVREKDCKLKQKFEHKTKIK